MSTSRWKLLTAYLPGIAAVVNSFHSTEVQLAVYECLIDALDEKTEAEEGVAATRKRRPAGRASAARNSVVPSMPRPLGDLAHDLVDGESIHAMTSP